MVENIVSKAKMLLTSIQLFPTMFSSGFFFYSHWASKSEGKRLMSFYCSSKVKRAYTKTAGKGENGGCWSTLTSFPVKYTSPCKKQSYR